MKTTLDLPDDLLIEAKAVAARRRTTLKDMVTHALRREIMAPGALEKESPFEVGPFGILRLKKRENPMTEEQMQKLLQLPDEEDFQRAVEIAGKR
jgi:hypothetical protein